MLGLTDSLIHPQMDMSSWESIFNSKCLEKELIMIECDNDGTEYFGKVVKVFKNCIYFLEFDAKGVWSEEPFIINYRDIDGIVWNSWYLNGWKYYFEQK